MMYSSQTKEFLRYDRKKNPRYFSLCFCRGGTGSTQKPPQSSPRPLERKRGWVAWIQLDAGGLSDSRWGGPLPCCQHPTDPSAQLRRRCAQRGTTFQRAVTTSNWSKNSVVLPERTRINSNRYCHFVSLYWHVPVEEHIQQEVYNHNPSLLP